ncbi:MAG: adenylyltransferase/cytidyltransferase family protein [Flavobacteriales bacterium]|nr:adenylyltransferase/cytidyltransferase family protein [Flavobacteriales bacterium]NNK79903.1 adenylyltransferase/cytidyltransferase family protein [Flavobacteriales bacterium]
MQHYLQNKLHDNESLSKQVHSWKSQGLSIGFTNGVFDIIHLGHVNYLQEASEQADRLIIGLNSDSSVKRLNKGPERPINSEQSRAIVLAGLHSVSAVCVFDQDTPLDLISKVLPDILMKGGDYDADCTDEQHPSFIVGSKEVKEAGGKVLSIPLVEGFSTTEAVRKLKENGN